MLIEASIFEIFNNLTKKQFADCYITIGNVIELKNFFHSLLNQSIYSAYDKIPKFINGTFANLDKISNEILSHFLFSTPQIFLIEQAEKLDPYPTSFESSSLKNNSLIFFEKFKSKPKEHFVIFDFQILPWNWSKKKFIQLYKNYFDKFDTQFIVCFDIRENDLFFWINSFCQIHNYKIESQATRYIIENIGNDVGKIIKELQKIFIFALPYKLIKIQHIKAFINQNIILTDFQLIESFVKKDADATINALLKMKLENYSPLDIYINLRTEIEKILFVKEHNEDELSAKNISHNAAYYLKKRADNFSVDELRKILLILDNSEKLMKESDKIAWDIIIAKIMYCLRHIK